MKSTKFLLSLLAFTMVAWTSSAREASAAGPALAIVVPDASPLQDISMANLKELFLLEVLQVPGSAAKVKFFAMPDNSPAQKIALSVIYKMSAADLKRLWLKKVFRNEIATEPTSVSGAGALGSAIAGQKGGVGYCLNSEIPAGLRAVKVDGKSPEDAGYSLVE